MHRPFTRAWADAFCDAINASEPYRAAARDWARPVALVLEPAPALGYPAPVALRLDLAAGRCRGVDILPGGTVAADFVLTGPWEAWRALLTGQLDPVMALVRRRITARGSLATIVRYAGAARALIECAREVPTLFPDEG